MKLSYAQRKAEILRLKRQGRGESDDRPSRVRIATSESGDRRGGRSEGQI